MNVLEMERAAHIFTDICFREDPVILIITETMARALFGGIRAKRCILMKTDLAKKSLRI